MDHTSLFKTESAFSLNLILIVGWSDLLYLTQWFTLRWLARPAWCDRRPSLIEASCDPESTADRGQARVPWPRIGCLSKFESCGPRVLSWLLRLASRAGTQTPLLIGQNQVTWLRIQYKLLYQVWGGGEVTLFRLLIGQNQVTWSRIPASHHHLVLAGLLPPVRCWLAVEYRRIVSTMTNAVVTTWTTETNMITTGPIVIK